jgi:hypothetical protein
MKAVANAGPLIALGKMGLVHLLCHLYDPVLIPAAVYEEVVLRGLESGQPDAYAVQMAIARHELIMKVDDTGEESTDQRCPGASRTGYLATRSSHAVARQRSPSVGILARKMPSPRTARAFSWLQSCRT